MAIPAPALSNKSVANIVAIEDAEMLTTLLPIKIALNIFPEFSITQPRVMAFLFPSSIKVRTRIRFTVLKAVSEDEKKADNANKTISIKNCVATLGSKKSTPFT